MRLQQAVQAGARACAPFWLLAVDSTPQLQQRCAEVYDADKYPPQQAPVFTAAPTRDKIRIAYLSADFHAHATAYLMAGVFE